MAVSSCNVISWRTELKTHFKSSSAGLNTYWDEIDCREKKVIYQMKGVKITLNLVMESLVKGEKSPSPCMFWKQQEQASLHILHGKISFNTDFYHKVFSFAEEAY